MALSAIGEGCHQQMEAILQEIVSFVLIFCSDPVRNDLKSFHMKMQHLEYYLGGNNKLLIPFPSAPKGTLCCLQRNWTNGHRLCPDLPKEVPRQGNECTQCDAVDWSVKSKVVLVYI